MTLSPIPATLAGMTPDWLTAVLHESGALAGERVVSARWERIGQEYGFTGLVGRVRLGYSGGRDDVPATLIAKLPMAPGDAVSGYRALQEREPARMRAHFERCSREACFYREVGAPFAPELYYSAVDDALQRVVLLLEDVGGGRQGDALLGCSIEDAARVIEHLAQFHARWWGERAARLGFPSWGGDAAGRQERYAQRVERFVEGYGDSLPSHVSDLVWRLRTRLGAVADAMDARPRTLIHADLHLDNMIFSARESGRSVVVLDWQTVSAGPPAWDVALFLVGSLSPEDRCAAEGELFRLYAEHLFAHGVHGYSADDLRCDYGLALLALLAGTVGWLTTLRREDLTGRERALHEAALGDGRLIAALSDHDVERLLDEVRAG